MRKPKRRSDSSRKIKPDGVDFISSLPEEILHHILSFTPTNYAIRTSALSKRWKRVWQETPSISIDCCDREDNPKSIDKTLRSYSALKITSFHVGIKYRIKTKLIDRWIKLATSRNAEHLSLKLDFFGSIPDSFYVNPSVKQLSLTTGKYLGTTLVPKCTVTWTSLRNLSLKYCELLDESIANILFGCPMLETLILNECWGLDRLDLTRSVNLTRLEIIRVFCIERYEIVGPHIHYLSLTNFHKPYALIDLFSLTDVKYNICYSEYRVSKADFLQGMVLKMLPKLQNRENLTIGVVVLQILSLAKLRGVPFPQLKIKALTLETMLVRFVIPGIIGLLQNSPGLKKITLYTTESKAIPDDELDWNLNARGLNNALCSNSFFPMVKETSSLFNSGHFLLFMELVMCNTRTLETMVLRLGGTLNATEYQNLLSMVPHNKNLRRDGLRNAILNSVKISP